MATINLSWSASAGASSGTYRIRYWLSTTPSNVIVLDNITGSSYTITGVDAQATYYGTVESKCIDGSYSSTQSWTAVVTATGGGGSNGLVTGINASTTNSNCSGGTSGTITINSADTRKVRLTTVYYSGTGPWPGGVLDVTNATTGDAVLQLSSSASTLYTPSSATSTIALGPGTYLFALSQCNCANGSGTSTISLVTP